MSVKKTPFTHFHEKMGARLVEFAGYLMPIEYSGVTDEHMTVRNGVGVFDVSHMGEFWVRGPQALSLIQSITSNDASQLTPGKVQYSCFPNGKGGIIDDLLVYHYSNEKYLLVVNAANIEKDWNWVNKNNALGATLENSSDETCQLAIQGPLAGKVLQKLTKTDLSGLKYYTFTVGEMAGIQDVIISATGYTGAGGFELYTWNSQADQLWNAIFEAGKEYGIKPIGLAARDTLRLEMGYCLYGNDIDDTTSPIEAGLGWITKFPAAKNFIDRDLLQAQKEKGVQRKLVGFELLDKGIPRHHYEITDEQGGTIGHVTSGTMSPVLKKGIGMGYVSTPFAEPETPICIKVRDKLLAARVIKLPFVQQPR